MSHLVKLHFLLQFSSMGGTQFNVRKSVGAFNGGFLPHRSLGQQNKALGLSGKIEKINKKRKNEKEIKKGRKKERKEERKKERRKEK